MGWVVNDTLRPFYLPEMTRYPFSKWLGGPQGRSGWLRSNPHPKFGPRTTESVASRYTDNAIPVHNPQTKVSINLQ